MKWTNPIKSTELKIKISQIVNFFKFNIFFQEERNNHKLLVSLTESRLDQRKSDDDLIAEMVCNYGFESASKMAKILNRLERERLTAQDLNDLSDFKVQNPNFDLKPFIRWYWAESNNSKSYKEYLERISKALVQLGVIEFIEAFELPQLSQPEVRILQGFLDKGVYDCRF